MSGSRAFFVPGDGGITNRKLRYFSGSVPIRPNKIQVVSLFGRNRLKDAISKPIRIFGVRYSSVLGGGEENNAIRCSLSAEASVCRAAGWRKASGRAQVGVGGERQFDGTTTGKRRMRIERNDLGLAVVSGDGGTATRKLRDSACPCKVCFTCLPELLSFIKGFHIGAFVRPERDPRRTRGRRDRLRFLRRHGLLYVIRLPAVRLDRVIRPVDLLRQGVVNSPKRTIRQDIARDRRI